MAQTTMTRESRPDDEATQPTGRRRWLPKILIAASVLLVVVIGGGLWYASSIDRSLTENIKRGVELPTDPSSVRPPKEPHETGTLNYVLIVSPVVKGQEYSPGMLLFEVFPTEAKQLVDQLQSFINDKGLNAAVPLTQVMTLGGM